MLVVFVVRQRRRRGHEQLVPGGCRVEARTGTAAATGSPGCRAEGSEHLRFW